MKKIFISILLTVLYSTVLSQSPYYDAIKLKQYLVEVDGKLKFIIPDLSSPDSAAQRKRMLEYCNLINDKYYNGRLNSPTSLHRFLSANPGPDFNPFLATYLRPGVVLSGDQNKLDKSPKFNLFSSLGAIPIPNEILLGVTDWIVKRTKQELSAYFFEDFKKQIEKYPDLRTVFPQTYRSLQILGEEIYNYQKYLKSLRSAFQNDSKDLVKNLPTIITNHPEFFERHPGLAATFNSGFYIAGALQDNIHPGDILNDYPAEYLDSLNMNWKGSIQALQLISGSLRDTASPANTDSVYWVTPKQVRELVKDKVAFRIYLGLVYQQAKSKYDSIHFTTAGGGITLVEILEKVAPVYETVYTAYSGYITRFSEKANKVNSLIKEYKNSGSDSSTFQLYFDYYNGVLDLLQQCTEISKLPFIRERIPNLADTLKDYFDVAHTSADLFLNIRQHNYSTAVVNTVHLYDMVKAIQAEKDVANTGLPQSLRETAKTFKPAKSNLFRYCSFLAAISEAQKPEEVEKIIESYALPSGSARIKKESLFNVSLNAYCGLFIGNEVIKNVDANNPFRKFNSYGLTAPIGVSVNWGRKNGSPFSKRDGHVNNWSHSLFISLVDLGAIAAFRFSDNTTSQVPSVQLKDIFSPGIFWSIGIPKSPLSVNVGVQSGANLRKVTSSKNDYSGNTYTRYSMSVCVDLPMLNLYNKSK